VANSRLFHDGDLSSTLAEHTRQVVERIESLPADAALGTPEQDLVDRFAGELRVEPVVIDWDRRTLEPNEVRVDVSGDPNRFFRDPGRPFYLPGTRLAFHFPFTGDEAVLRCRASQGFLTYPVADIRPREREIVISFEVPSPADPEAILKDLERQTSLITQLAAFANTDVERHNAGVEATARSAVERRRAKLLGDQNLIAALGIPLRRPESANPTFAVAPTRKKITMGTSASPVGRPAARPEPVLPEEVYEEILATIGRMVDVIERSPAAFSTLDEEALRTHLLVGLNGAFDPPATGETFNGEGKTDILFRHQGRATFIAECKFWKGEKALLDAIGQLLGYLTWRDTKAAILMFNRDRALSGVLAKVPGIVAKHPAFEREAEIDGETRFRFILRRPDDPERKIVLTVLVFEVPGPSSADRGSLSG
jgi:hypothetical protein